MQGLASTLRALQRRVVAGLACLTAASGYAVTPGPEDGMHVSATPLGDNRWSLTLELTEEVGQWKMQQLLLPAASKLCGSGLVPTLDAFRYRSRMAPGANAGTEEQADDGFLRGASPSRSSAEGSSPQEEASRIRSRLVQVVLCEPMRARAPSRALSDAERSALEEAIRARTLAFFRGLDAGGDPQTSYAMLGPHLGAEPFASWRRQQDQLRVANGEVRERRIWRTTVYVDPPQAPSSGVFVAADYETAYRNVLFECGYLMWQEQWDGRFRIIRHQKGLIRREEADRLALTSVQMTTLRERMGCPVAEAQEG